MEPFGLGLLGEMRDFFHLYEGALTALSFACISFCIKLNFKIRIKFSED